MLSPPYQAGDYRQQGGVGQGCGGLVVSRQDEQTIRPTQPPRGQVHQLPLDSCDLLQPKACG